MLMMIICIYLFFVFFRQKTAYDLRISDWSSDVCSSDLAGDVADGVADGVLVVLAEHAAEAEQQTEDRRKQHDLQAHELQDPFAVGAGRLDRVGVLDNTHLPAQPGIADPQERTA